MIGQRISTYSAPGGAPEPLDLSKSSVSATTNTSTRLVLLAPPSKKLKKSPGATVWADSLLADTQRMRGAVYLSDGAIRKSDLTPDGRHEQDADYRSWHLLSVDQNLRVHGCLRLLMHFPDQDSKPGVGLNSYLVAQSPALLQPQHGLELRRLIAHEIRLAAEQKVPFIEVGGWAVSEEHRRSGEAIWLVLSCFAFGRQFGQTRGLCTATVRHQSAAILKKIGGQRWMSHQQPDQNLSAYFDPEYGCDMELLRFQAFGVNPRFEPMLPKAEKLLVEADVLCYSECGSSRDLSMLSRGLGSVSPIRRRPHLNSQDTPTRSELFG
jgi:hypothetical protein